MWGRLAIGIIGLGLAACTSGTSGPTPTPLPTFPVAPEPLATAVETAPDAALTCGFPDHTFPVSALDGPTDAMSAKGPMFDSLRDAIDLFDFPGDLGALGWLVAQADDGGALFLARSEGGQSAWWYLVVEKDGSTWKPVGMGGCTLMVQLSSEFLPAQWALDPAYPAPDPASTELHVLVWELSCHDEYAATGRMSAPVVVMAATSVTITIGVRPLPGIHTCPGTPGTPSVVTLPEPLGHRDLLDGYSYPPAPPAPAF